MKNQFFIIAGIVIIAGLWWWFGGGPRGGGITSGLYVERNDNYTEPHSVFDNTDDVKLFGFKFINATSTDALATSTTISIDESSTFNRTNVKNVRLLYNGNQLASFPFLYSPMEIRFTPVPGPVLSVGSEGQFSFVADLHGTSTATTTLRVFLSGMQARDASNPNVGIPVKRVATDSPVWYENPEPSVIINIIPAGGR